MTRTYIQGISSIFLKSALKLQFIDYFGLDGLVYTIFLDRVQVNTGVVGATAHINLNRIDM